MHPRDTAYDPWCIHGVIVYGGLLFGSGDNSCFREHITLARIQKIYLVYLLKSVFDLNC